MWLNPFTICPCPQLLKASVWEHYFYFVYTKLLTMISASDLGKNAERAGLGGACPRMPVFSVFNQSLLASIAVGGCVVKFRIGIHNVLSRGAASRTGESSEWKGSETTWLGVATQTQAEVWLFAALKGIFCIWMQVCSSELYMHTSTFDPENWIRHNFIITVIQLKYSCLFHCY